jgi:hypothetical protein
MHVYWVYVNCMWWVYYTCARLIPGLVSRNHLQPRLSVFPRNVSTQGPLYPFAKQPLNFKFANADWDLTKIFANCKFDTPSSFQDILNNHTFSVRKCVRRNAREETQAPAQAKSWSAWSGPRDSEIFPHRDSSHNASCSAIGRDPVSLYVHGWDMNLKTNQQWKTDTDAAGHQLQVPFHRQK